MLRVGAIMDHRQKLMLQIRAMRSGLDPKKLAQMQKIAVAFFGPVIEGRAGTALAPPRPVPKPPAMDGKTVALRALEARQRRAGPDGFMLARGDAEGPLTGPDTGDNVKKTVELYMAELRKSRESAAEIIKRAAPAAPPKAAAKPALSVEDVEEKKRNFLKRWFVK